MKNKPNFTFRAIQDNKVVDRCQTHAKKRFYNRIRSIKWENRVDYVYLRVSYGKWLDVFGDMTNFYNDGDYETKEDLLIALSAFCE